MSEKVQETQEFEPTADPIVESQDSVDQIQDKSNSDAEKHEDLESNELHLVTSNTSTEFVKTRGVRRIENVKILMDDAIKGRTVQITFFVCLLVICWVRALDSSTTYSYDVPATSSYNRHSMVSTVGIATSIIGSVVTPILGKLSDITSRPLTLGVALAFYTVGTIIAAGTHTIGGYVVGQVLTAVGSSGISYLVTVITSDLTPLKWRGVINGVLATPYIINVWFSGLIVEAILARNQWRWGFGMFAILMPVTVIPPIVVLHYYETKAQKLAPKVVKEKKAIWKVIWDACIEIDAFGLIVMGFGWSLLLLPFSLYSYANDGWKNPSIIAMIVVGGVLLIAYAVYEIMWCPFPSMPKRIIYNKTFVTAVIMDWMYQLAGAIRGTYLSSVILVSKDITYQNWVYYNNTLTMSLCIFGVVAGVICRVTHRYKWLQVFGLLLKILAYGIGVRPEGQIANLATFIMQQTLIGMGGAFTVIGTQTSSQASVPHQDLSLVIALLSLWSSVGAAIGGSIAAPIWTSKLPGLFRKYMPSSLTDAEVLDYYTNYYSLYLLPYDDPIRQGAIKAFGYVTYPLFVAPVVLEVVSLICGLFQTNYYLGDNHNAIEGLNGRDPTDPTKEQTDEKPQGFKAKLLYLLS